MIVVVSDRQCDVDGGQQGEHECLNHRHEYAETQEQTGENDGDCDGQDRGCRITGEIRHDPENHVIAEHVAHEAQAERVGTNQQIADGFDGEQQHVEQDAHDPQPGAGRLGSLKEILKEIGIIRKLSRHHTEIVKKTKKCKELDKNQKKLYKM